jgi:hypothetical protein
MKSQKNFHLGPHLKIRAEPSLDSRKSGFHGAGFLAVESNIWIMRKFHGAWTF